MSLSSVPTLDLRSSIPKLDVSLSKSRSLKTIETGLPQATEHPIRSDEDIRSARTKLSSLARKIADAAFLVDMKEIEKIKLESTIRLSLKTGRTMTSSSPRSPAKPSTSAASPKSSDRFVLDRSFLLEVPPLDSSSTLSGAWKFLILIRSEVRQQLRAAKAIDGKEDRFIQLIIDNLHEAPPDETWKFLEITAQYISLTVQAECGLQAFIALGPTLLSKMNESRSIPVVLLVLTELLDKLHNHPEVAAYLIQELCSDHILIKTIDRLRDLRTLSLKTFTYLLNFAKRNYIPKIPSTNCTPWKRGKISAREEISRFLDRFLEILGSQIDRILLVLFDEDEKVWTWKFLSAMFSASSVTGKVSKKGFVPFLIGDALNENSMVRDLVTEALKVYRKSANIDEVVSALDCLETLASGSYVAREVMVSLGVPNIIFGELDAESDAVLMSLRIEGFSKSEPTMNSPPNTAMKLRKSVPILRLSGLPPSVQGAAAIGAIPAEEASRTAQKVDEKIINLARQVRRCYSHPKIHRALLSLAISLLLTPRRKLLDTSVADPFPALSGRVHFLHILDKHVNHPLNESVVASLFPEAHAKAKLLKLIVHKFDLPFLRKTNSQVIGGGAFGTVIGVGINFGKSNRDELAIKLFPANESKADRSHLFAVYNEVMAMESVHGSGGVLPLWDHFNDGTNYNLVTPYCDGRISDIAKNSSILKKLEIFGEVIAAVRNMHDRGLVHYDLKGDNLLIRNNRVLVADFGEARVMESLSEPPCLLNRGTELVKSPEMVSVANAMKKDGLKFDRRKPIGTTTASDVWSLGCLLYEIMTGEYLFLNTDWVSFFMRITGEGSHSLLSKENETKLDNEILKDFMLFMLVPDPIRRPDIHAVCRKFKKVYAQFCSSETIESAASFESALSEPKTLTDVTPIDLKSRFYITHASQFHDGVASFRLCSDVVFTIIANDHIYNPKASHVIDCTGNLLSSPLMEVLSFTERGINEQVCNDSLRFARRAFYHGGSIEIVDSNKSSIGQGFMISVFLAAVCLQMTLYQAFTFAVSTMLIPTSSNALQSLNVIASFLPSYQMKRPREVISCFCGSIWFKFEHDISRSTDCSKDAKYSRWVEKRVGKSIEIQFIICDTLPLASVGFYKGGVRPCKNDSEIMRKYKCEVCGFHTHSELLNGPTVQFELVAHRFEEKSDDQSNDEMELPSWTLPSLEDGLRLI